MKIKITEEQIRDPIHFRRMLPGMVNQKLFRSHRQAWAARSYAQRVGDHPAGLFMHLALNPQNMAKLTALDEAEGGRLYQHYEEAQDIFDRGGDDGAGNDCPRSRDDSAGRISFREFCISELGQEGVEMSTAEVTSRLEAKSKADKWEQHLLPDLQKKLTKMDEMKKPRPQPVGVASVGPVIG